MITAVDTSVLLDVFTADRRFGAASRSALASCLAEGGLVACDVVWAEITGSFDSAAAAARALDRLTVEFDAIDAAIASSAGTLWRRHRQAGGTRQHIVPDFLVGAHAAARADRLLTRDRGFYRSYFKGLRILDPSTPSTARKSS